MAVLARLYCEGRSAERHPVALGGTLRDRDVPHDVMIDELSVSGFRMVAPIEVAIGAVLGLGIPALGRRPMRVVRRNGDRIGCEFLSPLTAQELETVRSAPPFAPSRIGAALDGADSRFPARERKLPRPVRLAVIAGLGAIPWAGMAATAWAFSG